MLLVYIANNGLLNQYKTKISQKLKIKWLARKAYLSLNGYTH